MSGQTCISPPTADLAPARRLSGFKPTGRLHLGNYLGAIAGMVAGSGATGTDSIIMIADLHALTVEHDPARLRSLTTELLATLLAAGVDPDSTTCYVQSDVAEHASLHYLLECATGYGEAARMIQFREKAAGSRHVRLSLLTYPVLMAADILLHDAGEVPVGDDQTQHLELARDVANRFNTRYGRTFVVPRASRAPLAARVMDLTDPTAKMGKSSGAGPGVVFLLDPPDTIRHKITKARTDSGSGVDYDPVRRPGLANLVELLAALTGEQPAATAGRLGSCAQLKEELTSAVVATLAPIRQRYEQLRSAPDHLAQVRAHGAGRASNRAAVTLTRARQAIGLGG